LLGKIPFTKEYASDYASGNILNKIPLEIESTYLKIAEKLVAKTLVK
jgi:hypothetical protein